MERSKTIRTAIGVCVLSLTLSAASPARTLYIDDDAPADFRTIQAAIDDANNGDTVIIRPGTYTGPGNRDIDFRGKAVTVTGTDPNDWDVVRRTVVDCGGTVKEPHRGFLFASGEGGGSVLSGVKITGGYAPSISLPVYKKLVGGGICCNQSGPTITHCVICGNLAEQGGGGLFTYDANPSIRHCEFRSNTCSGGEGGALDVWGGRAVVTGCSITGNYGHHGGGINGWACTLLLDNCLIRHNECRSWGAALCVQGSVESRIVNCTIIDNHNEDGTSPAVEFVNGAGPVQLANCIIWGNSLCGIRSQDTQYSERRADYCCIEGWNGLWAGAGSFGNDPLLTRDGHLQPGSPCVDAGDPNSSSIRASRDIDGETRIHGARVDIGCDEFIDADGDDLADTWERRYFADLASANATGNHDGDPWDNKSEYMRSSNPLHPPTAYYVDPVQGNDGWDGLSASWNGTHGPKATIRAALNQAQAHDLDQVVLIPGSHTGEGNGNIDFDGKEVTIRSVDPNDPAVVAATIIDCNGVHPLDINPYMAARSAIVRRAFVLRSGENAEAGIKGLTIINGTATSDGGAVLCEWSSPQIVNCVFRNNESAMRGGAIACRNGSVVIEWCTLEQNRARYGGAIACSSVDGRTRITNCTIRANTAVSAGGGAVCGSGTDVAGCLITANEAQGSGDSWGWYLLGGGGVMLEGIGAVLANCTIAGNSARCGSGLLSGCVDDGKGLATLYNCIVWGNSGGEENQIMFSRCCPGCVRTVGPVAIRARRSCIEGGADLPLSNDGMYFAYIEDANCLHSDPRFVSPETGDYRLRADSPCIDAGGSELPARLCATDLDGMARWVDFDGDGVALIDMGVYESRPSDETLVVPSWWTLPFHVYDSAPVAEPQTLTIRSRGSGSFQWTLDCNCPWLDISPASGEAGTEVTMRVDAAGLPPGTYDCRPVIHAVSAANSPVSVLVELQVSRVLKVPESYGTMQDAVDAAASGDMILLADGVYTGPGNRNVTFPAKSLEIRSERGPQDCIIDCQSTEAAPFAGFFLLRPGARTVLEGLTIAHARYGIRIGGNHVTLRNCDLVDCEVGCDADASQLTIAACRFHGAGTAASVYRSDVRVLDCEVMHNASGMAFGSSQVVIRNTVISQNRGGIGMTSCFDTSIDHCLITGNGSSRYGSQAIDLSDTEVAIRNCTIVGNTNWWDKVRASAAPTDITKAGLVVNSIFWNNHHVIEDLLPRCMVGFSDIQGGWPGEGNIDADPLFSSPGHWNPDTNVGSPHWIEGDYHLQSQAGRWEPVSRRWVVDGVTSPCIDAGDPNSPVEDEPQPNGGRANMGAYGGTAEASKSYVAP